MRKTLEDLNKITDFKQYEEFLKNCFICFSGTFYEKIKIKKNSMISKYFFSIKSNNIKLKDFLEENGNHFVINFNKIKYANLTEFKLIFLLKEEIKNEKDYIPFEIYDEDDNLIYVNGNEFSKENSKILEFTKIRTVVVNELYEDINYWNCKGFEDENLIKEKGDELYKYGI
jgi:hypothetical protein